jgi:hypothetical protein
VFSDVLELDDFAEELEAKRREMVRPFFEAGRLASMGDEPEEAARLVETALQLFSHYEDALLLGGQLAMQAGVAFPRFDAAPVEPDMIPAGGTTRAKHQQNNLHLDSVEPTGSQPRRR